MALPSASIRYLFSLLGAIRKESFGLHRMEWLMDELGRPDQAPGIVHIAGTNGKGSTAAMIESGLRASGHTTGLYTSPHLTRLNERFALNGLAVSDAVLATAIEPVRRANEHVVATRGPSAHPTFFESVTAAALVLFCRENVRYKIVETGLGGRLDASNVVRPEVSVLTRVQRDHERYLGRDLARIAAEKADIVKPGCRAVIGLQEPSALGVLLRRCEEVDVQAVDVGTEWQACEAASAAGYWRFEARGCGKSIPIKLALAGEHQIENALTAIAALNVLGVDEECIASGLGLAKWPGRLECASRRPFVLLDAAHNPGGARALSKYLGREARGRKVTLIYGCSRDKAVDEIAAWMFPAADRVILTRSKVQRAASPEALRDAVGHHHPCVDIAPDIKEALGIARRETSEEDWIVVAGSLFLVGEAREALG